MSVLIGDLTLLNIKFTHRTLLVRHITISSVINFILLLPYLVYSDFEVPLEIQRNERLPLGPSFQKHVSHYVK